VFAPWFTGFIIIVRIKIVTYQYPQADEIFLYLSIILDIVGYISDYISKFNVILSNRAQVLWIDKLVLICSNARIHWHSMHHIAMCFVTNCFTHLCVLSSRDNTDHLQWLVLSEMELAQWWTYLDEDIYNQQWYIYIYLGKFHHDLTSPEPWNHVFYRGIIPKGPQVSGKWIIIICPTHTHIYIYIHTYIHKCQSVRKWRIVHCHVSGGWIILIQPVIESKWWTHGFFFFGSGPSSLLITTDLHHPWINDQ